MVSWVALTMLAPVVFDQGAMIGLRDNAGNYRTVLVAQQGVAYSSRVKEGVLLRSLKLSVHAFAPLENGIQYQNKLYPLMGRFRIGWSGVAYIGLEFDDSRAGEASFTRLHRGVVHIGSSDAPTPVLLKTVLRDYGRTRLDSAISKAGGGKAGVPNEPDDRDWGYVRYEGRWQFVGALLTPERRYEFVVPGTPVTDNPPIELSEVSWRSARSRHADATDLVARSGTPFAIVVTPDALYVHEASEKSLGRMVRKIASKNETIVCFEFGASGVLQAWLEYFKD